MLLQAEQFWPHPDADGPGAPADPVCGGAARPVGAQHRRRCQAQQHQGLQEGCEEGEQQQGQ